MSIAIRYHILLDIKYKIKALDAKATNIDIFLDIEKFSLQVNDDGSGIQNLGRIGQRHGEFKINFVLLRRF